MSKIDTGATGGGGGSGTVTSVLGTANQVDSDGSTTTPTLYTPSTFIAPGTIAATTTVTGTRLISTVAIGTAPLTVTSTTNVANLNASSLSGATFSAPGAIGGGTPSTGAFTTLSATTWSTKQDIADAPSFGADAGASDTYACNLTPAITAYVTGTHYRFKANTANTGAATINFNTVGAATIVKVAGGITTALADNDIRAGQWVDLVYDGTNMQMQSTLGNAASGSGTVNSGTANQVAYYPATAAAVSGTTGLTYDGTHILTVSVAGGGAGTLALSGNTSGTATLAAPAVAGTNTNGITFSNVILAPAIGTGGNAAYGFVGNATSGLVFDASFSIALQYAGLSIWGGSNSGGTAIRTGSTFGIGWSSGASATANATDTAFWRPSAGLVTLGGVTANTSTGALKLSSVQIAGTKFTTDTGCGTVTSLTGGATAGSFVAQATGACTVVITMGDTATAPNGWNCSVNDRTTANLFRQTASSTTTATVSGTSVTSDVISFSCTGY